MELNVLYYFTPEGFTTNHKAARVVPRDFVLRALVVKRISAKVNLCTPTSLGFNRTTMTEIHLSPIAQVHNTRFATTDDNWGSLVSEIILDPSMPEESLDGLDAFSHVEIIYHFHLVAEADIVTGARHPRDNPDWPKVGIFAQRGRVRPNRLGLTVVRLLQREGRSLFVEGLDAVDGTPVLDIKPIMAEFLPREPVRQPEWSHEVMMNYWSSQHEV